MNLPNTICMLPWISIEASPMGTVRPCCITQEEILDHNGTKFDLKTSTLQDAYKSEYMQNLRQKFLFGDKPETCKSCWKEEDAGKFSKRMFSKIRLKELFPIIDWQNKKPNQLWFLDLKLGNICNLKCRICGSWSSSKWAAEEMEYLPPKANRKKHIAYTWLQQGKWPEENELFWTNLKELLPNVKYIEFTGGEPWLIQEHIQLLEYAVKKGLDKEIEIHYNTNGTQWNEKLVQLWTNFKRVNVAFSVDNVGKRFEYERYGADWDTVNLNIETVNLLKQYQRNITSQLCFTVNIQNVYYLDQLLAWADTQTFNDIHFNVLHNPDRMCIQRMTATAKTMVLAKLRNSSLYKTVYHNEIENLVRFIKNGPGSDGTDFVEKMQQTDQYRNQNFIHTHPEIAKAMGYETHQNIDHTK